MKRFLYLIVAVFCINFAAQAAPGDTTVVYATNAQLSWYGNYDSVVVFPHAGTSYRRIYMVFTLGKYMCGSGATYCGDWDYTVLNYVITSAGETFELGRLITPYANAGAPRTPWTWQQHYVYDVTDYAAKLHDTATIRTLFSGYSGGFTENIKFLFIEGTPDRSVMDIKRLWNGSFSYGDTSHGGANDINNHFTAITESAPAGTQTADVKFTVTGHGSDPNYCNEFCSHNYQVLLNGTPVTTKTVWRSDCGSNELYPQSGTWLYQRANWCPGDMVYSHDNILPNITGGMTFNTSIKFDDYIGNGGASYTTEATLIYYGGMNKTLDASVEDIIAPTNNENHFRENPANMNPVIVVKNTGATTINSMNIQYGVTGSSPLNYTWTGSLSSLLTTTITLPSLPDLSTDAGTSVTYQFVSTITSVNGVADDDATNNTMQSQFVAAPVYPSSFRIEFATNNEALTSNPAICETSWIIYDSLNNQVASRQNANISTLYNDTVNLLPGNYRMQIYDSSCDGLNWWVFSASGSGITSGYITLQKLNPTHTQIPLNGYPYSGTYSDDFGCGIVQYFTVVWPEAIHNVSSVATGITAYPNPAQNLLNIDLEGMNADINGTISVFDGLGRLVLAKECSEAHNQLNTASLANGVYIVQFTDNKNPENKLLAHIVIAK